MKLHVCKPKHAALVTRIQTFAVFLLLQPKARFGQIIIATDGQ